MHKLRGFTIVELLIVIVVIAILAAISIAAYTSISSRANDSAVQSDLSQFAKLITVYKIDNGAYPSTLAQVKSLGPTPATKDSYADEFIDGGPYNYLYCFNNTTDQFGLVARSASGKYFHYRDGSTKPYTGEASTSVAAMCPNIGVAWDSRIWLYSTGIWVI